MTGKTSCASKKLKVGSAYQFHMTRSRALRGRTADKARAKRQGYQLVPISPPPFASPLPPPPQVSHIRNTPAPPLTSRMLASMILKATPSLTFSTRTRNLGTIPAKVRRTINARMNELAVTATTARLHQALPVPRLLGS